MREGVDQAVNEVVWQRGVEVDGVQREDVSGDGGQAGSGNAAVGRLDNGSSHVDGVREQVLVEVANLQADVVAVRKEPAKHNTESDVRTRWERWL